MAIVSGGALVLSDTSPSYARSSFYPSVGVSLTDQFASYGAIYRNQLWVYVVVNKRARATARLPLKVYERVTTGRDEKRDSPYARILRRPNHKHDPFFLWLWTSSTLDIYGEAMWVKLRGTNGKPAELWPVHPALMEVKKFPVDKSGKIVPWAEPGGPTATFYVRMDSPQSAVPLALIPERDVVHFRLFNPDNTVRGLSPCEPLRQTLVNEDAARRATSAYWKNGARPAIALRHPKVLSPEAAARLRANWDEIYAGPENTGRTALLEEGLEVEKIALNLEEAQYINTRKLNREEVCACWDMAPPAVGILERATYNNIEELLKGLYRDTLPPHIGLLEAAMEQQLRPEFADDGIYAEFLMDEILRGTFTERAEKVQAGINSGQLTPNEGRALDNRPPLPGGNQLLVNSTLNP